ncbi:MAG TPA: dTDP-4-dehydrorhamnose reductase [Candidatus Limnocylindrales bacterium]|nr:dTDP-4-dehydrorhamnose reductase [Candidatus Limnocylindrales bacterium]
MARRPLRRLARLLPPPVRRATGRLGRGLSTTTRRVAVTGAGGRLGRALMARLRESGREAAGWGRPDYDLDDPTAAARLVARDRPAVVIHAAAWTDVDGCAREPEIAMRRNAAAAAELAEACAQAGTALVVVSTNEVFDGERSDGQGYSEADAPRPINPYGASKLAGEVAARRAYAAAGKSAPLWIVRTAWLYGPPGNDFPSKILAAARRLPPGEPLRVVTDETGSPTYAPDLATAIVRLLDAAPGGVYHLAGLGAASRHAWAQRVLAAAGLDAPLMAAFRADFPRASTPPAWAVLDSSLAAGLGISLRPWQDAFDEYAGGSLGG